MEKKLTRAEAKASIVAALTKHVDSMEKSLDTTGGVCLTNTNFIIMVDGIAVDPVIKENKVQPGSTGHGLPNEVKRFSEETAKALAANVTNGNGTKGTAVPWVQATEIKLQEYKKQLEIIKDI